MAPPWDRKVSAYRIRTAKSRLQWCWLADLQFHPVLRVSHMPDLNGD